MEPIKACVRICGVTWYLFFVQMTAGELKFAILVENIFNNIPQPEYRQLMVECLMVLTMLVDPFKTQFISENLNVDEYVRKANEIFYQQEVNFLYF